jgi:hypothetical protein
MCMFVTQLVTKCLPKSPCLYFSALLQVLKGFPDCLQADICLHLNRNLLSTNPAFKQASPGKSQTIALCVCVVEYMQHYGICRQFHQCISIYIAVQTLSFNISTTMNMHSAKQRLRCWWCRGLKETSPTHKSPVGPLCH